MKATGIMVCVIGSIAAILYAPYTILGGVKWGFIYGDIVAMFGKSIKVYEHLDFKTLLIELAVINALGLGIVIGAGSKK